MAENLDNEMPNGLLTGTLWITLSQRMQRPVHRECLGSIRSRPDILAPP